MFDEKFFKSFLSNFKFSCYKDFWINDQIGMIFDKDRLLQKKIGLGK